MSSSFPSLEKLPLKNLRLVRPGEEMPVTPEQAPTTPDQLTTQLHAGVEEGHQAVDRIAGLLRQMETTSAESGIDVSMGDFQARLTRIQEEMRAIAEEVARRTAEAKREAQWGGLLREKAERDARFEQTLTQIGALYGVVNKAMEPPPTKEGAEVDFSWERLEQADALLRPKERELEMRIHQDGASFGEITTKMEEYLALETELGVLDLHRAAKQIIEAEGERYKKTEEAFARRALEIWNNLYPDRQVQDISDPAFSGEELFDRSETKDPALVQELDELRNSAMKEYEAYDTLREKGHALVTSAYFMPDYAKRLVLVTKQRMTVEGEQFQKRLQEAGKKPFVEGYIETVLRPQVEVLVKSGELDPGLAQRFLAEYTAFSESDTAGEFSFESGKEKGGFVLNTLQDKNGYKFVSVQRTLGQFIEGRLQLERVLALKRIKEVISEACTHPALKERLGVQGDDGQYASYSSLYAEIDRDLKQEMDGGLRKVDGRGYDMVARARVFASALPVAGLFSPNAERVASAATELAAADAIAGFGIYELLAERTTLDEGLLQEAVPTLKQFGRLDQGAAQDFRKVMGAIPPEASLSALNALAAAKDRHGERGFELLLKGALKNKDVDTEELAIRMDAIVAAGGMELFPPSVANELFPTLLSVPSERCAVYMEIMERIFHSPSQAIQRIGQELARELLQASDPIKAYEQIEEVFIKNHLPTVGKVFRIFEILNPEGVLEQKLHKNPHLSPTLKAQGYRQRMFTAYTDLLKVHIESGNPSLKAYVELLVGVGPVLDTLERAEGEFESLTAEEQAQFVAFTKKIKALYENSQLGRMEHAVGEVAEEASPAEALRIYRGWKESLKVPAGGSVTDRIAEMFFKPLGYTKLEEILGRMESAKMNADTRGREMVSRAAGGKIDIRPEDLLKAVNHSHLTSILQNGSVAKEFLGSDAGSDETPLDTDLSRVTPEDAALGLREAIQKSLANNRAYGELLMIVRPRGQFVETSDEQPEKELELLSRRTRGKYELFHTEVLGKERHMGIRTGFPTTEIDCFVMRDSLYSVVKDRENIFMGIAQNGFYIPVADESGKIVFTPELFDEYRRLFRGQAEVNDAPIEQVPLREAPAYEAQLGGPTGEIAHKHKDIEVIKGMTARIHDTLKQVLKDAGVNLHVATGDSIVGAQLFDVGSSARFTNVPGSYDFDINVRLDAQDMQRVDEIRDRIKEALHATRDEYYTSGEGQQLRLYGANVQGESVDIDLAFTSKSELIVFNSHDAAEARLEAIKKQQGEAAYERVLANISLAKQLLKEAHAYKRLEDGGIGGMGVENWLLAHQGSLLEACRTFARASRAEDGARVGFTDFQERYHMLDPGINEKFRRHDNYVRLMEPAAYEKMATAVEAFLEKMEGVPVQAFAQAA